MTKPPPKATPATLLKDPEDRRVFVPESTERKVRSRFQGHAIGARQLITSVVTDPDTIRPSLARGGAARRQKVYLRMVGTELVQVATTPTTPGEVFSCGTSEVVATADDSLVTTVVVRLDQPIQNATYRRPSAKLCT